jgi:hypothetical protein
MISLCKPTLRLGGFNGKLPLNLREHVPQLLEPQLAAAYRPCEQLES